MNRKTFLKQTAWLAAGYPLLSFRLGAAPPQVMTVNGPLSARQMGMVLPHEHVLVDFIGAGEVGPHRYQAEAVMKKMIPFLKETRAAGCNTFVDATPRYLGRDVALLQRISNQTGLQIITNTGYYSAVHNKYLPEHAFTETAEQLAARWIGEFREGIEGTGIKPGFIKISVDREPLTEINKKIVGAAALTHLATGLTIASHTGSGKAALEQLDLLASAGVAANAFIWVHAQNEQDRNLHQEAAQRGAWLEFDGLGWGPLQEYSGHISFMKRAGFLKQLLVSHDAGWYHVGEEGGGAVKPFTPLFLELIPELRRQGYTHQEIRLLFIQNPARAFTLQVRRMKSRKL